MITDTVHYVLDGSTIVAETRKDEYGTVTHQFYYYYDENGAPIGLNWNGQDYYYYKNIFGDILGIFNSSGTLVVRYSYDAWGCNLGVTGTMATTLGRYNPFRYRGYYYDNETGMYYLNARYYNPYWCRFISPDPVIDTGSAVGCNLFTYCGNDPINRIDPTGCSPAAAGWAASMWWLCGADGVLPFGEIIYLVGCAIAGYSIADSITQNPPVTAPSASIPKSDSKKITKELAKDIAIPKKKKYEFGETYYHVTSLDALKKIQTEGKLRGSPWEGDYVFAWKHSPSDYSIARSGAHLGVVISFKTIAPFARDNGIKNFIVQLDKPVVSVMPGPIPIWDIKFVRFTG
ncbi:MAG: RHS repeat-associated core domain-containing protein [Clostridia bacterium]|nr:RHS repeat-associated core domain-containing protein [Clostridia bacterium]